MRVVVIGSGGREHALGWAIRRSPLVREVIGLPGNPGWDGLGPTWTDLDVADAAAVVNRCAAERIDLVVVGPEAPLVAGLADALRAAGIRVFGPGADGAALEGSKAFSKEFMRRHGIRTAAFAVFDALAPALDHVRREGAPIVIKADGLAAGKGVVVAATLDEAEAALHDMLGEGSLGAAGRRVVVEALLPGEEVSVLALCDGRSIVALAPSQDHKRIFDDDRGPNTGGMGAYVPTTLVDDELAARIHDEVLAPSLAGLQADGIDFRGVLYCGLMVQDGTPWVLEYNVRFGDPECQPLMLHLQDDIVPWLVATAEARLAEQPPLRWRDGSTVCVVMAAAGYPGTPRRGDVIAGLGDWRDNDDVVVFQAGTTRNADGRVVTAGGRVLGVTAHGLDIAAARQLAYAAVERLAWDGVQVRRDIGVRELKRRGG
jgi:phosphoribosylamine--glycine ligase